ncbi:hypothetical protein [Vibrio gazogenes]|uniref:Uncharacterized protein n=1 Tax=Vibrio gazogenes TaxID=687 RepID=A0A1Z2SKU8_VIBGA|nr:hypothetical protein [Vibrio gazogenes]ASA57812.1 hypothetical protein BSQ33_18955 [Vibrio gazogenes]
MDKNTKTNDNQLNAPVEKKGLVMNLTPVTSALISGLVSGLVSFGYFSSKADSIDKNTDKVSELESKFIKLEYELPTYFNKNFKPLLKMDNEIKRLQIIVDAQEKKIYELTELIRKNQ